MTQKRLRKLIFSAMFCALVFAATWISIPAPLVGNVNLGDGVLLLCAWMLGGAWAAVSAAMGAALCDLALGYAIYAPATLVIKALMVVVAIAVVKLLSHLHMHVRVARLISAVCAELIMILGYFAYEALALGYGIAAAANIPFNAIQVALGITVALVVYEVLHRAGIKIE